MQVNGNILADKNRTRVFPNKCESEDTDELTREHNIFMFFYHHFGEQQGLSSNQQQIWTGIQLYFTSRILCAPVLMVINNAL